jgi:hypothetical protein
MKKNNIYIIYIATTLLIFKPLKVCAQDVSIGYRTGFYLSHSLSVEKYINRFTSIEVNAGHRFNGGLINTSSKNFSRTGVILNIKQFFHKSFDPYYFYNLYNNGPKFYWTLGIATSLVNEGKISKTSYTNMGILAGIGMDIKVKDFIGSITILPSYDFLYGPHKSRFIWYRATGISLRKPL